MIRHFAILAIGVNEARQPAYAARPMLTISRLCDEMIYARHGFGRHLTLLRLARPASPPRHLAKDDDILKTRFMPLTTSFTRI